LTTKSLAPRQLAALLLVPRREHRQAAGAIAQVVKQSCQVMRPAATETVKGPLSRYSSVAPCWFRQEKRPQTRNRRSISGKAKCNRRACRSNTRTLRVQPAQYRSERNASCQPPDQYATTTATQSVAPASIIKISGSS